MKTKKGYKYQLYEDESIFVPGPLPTPNGNRWDLYESTNRIIKANDFLTFRFNNESGQLDFKKGYASDGLTGCPDFDAALTPALAHDGGYQILRHGLLNRKTWKPVFDKLFYDLLIKNGVWPIIARPMYQAVKCFGTAATLKPRPIITVP